MSIKYRILVSPWDILYFFLCQLKGKGCFFIRHARKLLSKRIIIIIYKSYATITDSCRRRKCFNKIKSKKHFLVNSFLFCCSYIWHAVFFLIFNCKGWNEIQLCKVTDSSSESDWVDSILRKLFKLWRILEVGIILRITGINRSFSSDESTWI